MVALSVNINKIALVRNSRGQNTPDLISFSEKILDLGAHGITVHPRPDERHITFRDVLELKKSIFSRNTTAELNIEGNPFDTVSTGRGSYPGYLEMVLETKPDQATLVPDQVDQLTSDHGWNLREQAEQLEPLIQKLKQADIRVSLFLDPEIPLSDLPLVKEMGADRVEIYTEKYARSFDTPQQSTIAKQYRELARELQNLGLEVNAGHDLNQMNLSYLLEEIPFLKEVSIGHALVCECLLDGLETTIANYLKIIQ